MVTYLLLATQIPVPSQPRLASICCSATEGLSFYCSMTAVHRHKRLVRVFLRRCEMLIEVINVITVHIFRLELKVSNGRIFFWYSKLGEWAVHCAASLPIVTIFRDIYSLKTKHRRNPSSFLTVKRGQCVPPHFYPCAYLFEDCPLIF